MQRQLLRRRNCSRKLHLPANLSSSTQYKKMIARVIIFKPAHYIICPFSPAFQTNITAYTVPILPLRLGARFDFERAWQGQAISSQLHKQIAARVHEVVSDALHDGTGGRMISEWAKKPNTGRK
ncbi:TPA: AIPR family protein [Pseudomonas aeruginosa]|uniref:AIPR family protein n=1 Tax=Pseudomonas aeruginosa TaxID=287 RepID=UPI001F217F3F|nr:AIPR family protein [Pseudomonas aeruginosa]MDP5598375.1 AIPR family protein [Pseudomonas aeruginosa]